MFKRIKAFFKELFTAQELEIKLDEFPANVDPVPPLVTAVRPMKRQLKSILLSAGHSDNDPGATGTWKGKTITEADIVLDLRNRIAEIVQLRGYEIITDGDVEQNLPLTEAIKLAQGVDVAIELHCNAFHLPTATGVEVLTGGNHKGLSSQITEVISSTLGITNRGVKPEASGQHSRLGFISKGGGIIVELMFITNQYDLTQYFENEDALADKLATALIDYIT